MIKEDKHTLANRYGIFVSQMSADISAYRKHKPVLPSFMTYSVSQMATYMFQLLLATRVTRRVPLVAQELLTLP
jgi:hypothetical protein